MYKCRAQAGAEARQTTIDVILLSGITTQSTDPPWLGWPAGTDEEILVQPHAQKLPESLSGPWQIPHWLRYLVYENRQSPLIYVYLGGLPQKLIKKEKKRKFDRVTFTLIDLS